MGRFAAAGLGGLTLLNMIGCASSEQDESNPDPSKNDALPAAGSWRASLDSPGGPITFGIDLAQADDGRLRATLINGVERREAGFVDPIPGGVVIAIPPYRSRLVAEIDPDGGALIGRWERDRGKGHKPVLAFAAVRGAAPAQTNELDAASAERLSGRWRVDFKDDDDVSVGLFEARADGSASGTFLTTLGDYRYLDGHFDGESLHLACFDGAHAFLFSATMDDEGALAGEFWSRDSYHDTWTAVKDPDAALPDDFALTSWTGGVDLGSLKFPGLDGQERALNDPAFAGDARIIVVFGSWCPNCYDLTEALVRLNDTTEGLSILGVAFELGDDPAGHARAVRDYMTHHGATYPVLIGGTADKSVASAALPILDRVRAYPTTIFMDREGNVSAVHTGFSGPATGEKHTLLLERFESLIAQNLASSEGR